MPTSYIENSGFTYGTRARNAAGALARRKSHEQGERLRALPASPYVFQNPEDLRLCPRALLLGEYKLADFRSLSVEVRKMLRPKSLVHLELLLGQVLFSHSDVGLRQPVMDVGQVWIEFTRPQIFRDGFRVFSLVRVEIG